MSDLLFEIGCEEIPAKMLARALADTPKLVEDRLAAARLEHKGVTVVGTPRRLAIIVKDLSERQPDLNEEVVGPPVSAAFAPDGTLTKAGQGFAAKNGVAPESLQKKEVAGKKGQYVVAVRDVKGHDARSLLPQLLGELAAAIPWPKSQRWGWGETTFVRPVQWLVALVGGEVLPLSWANLTAGRATRGHRFLSTGTIDIANAGAYVETLRAAHVIVDPEERKQRVRDELARVEREHGLTHRPDPGLVDEVSNIGEFPVGLIGGFDPSFLEVPEEIIVTAMRNHQRYFALEKDGKLAPAFATMMATTVKDPAVVRRGNEYVIASRLADAKFFVAEDRKKGSFDEWNRKLDAVVFQAKLGDQAKTIGNKTARLAKISAVLAKHVGANVDEVVTAAKVAKADLASYAVGEFPELQGVMGRHYAKDFGFSPAVATAIDEHWWPKGQGAALPTTDLGAIISLADKMDTIVGAFGVGLEPTGSADPFGLRRAAIGIWQILLARPAWATAFTALYETTRDVLSEQTVLKSTTTVSPEDFFKARLRGILVESGLPAQDVDAALAKNWLNPVDARARATALGKMPKEARAVFKRIANILDDAATKKIVPSRAVDPAKFASDTERELWKQHEATQSDVTAAIRDLRYGDVFDVLARIQPAVNAYFDKGGVMVMDPDAALRDNRLSTLSLLIEPYMAIADFRLLGAQA